MFDKLSEKIVCKFCDNEIILKEDSDLYKYGINVGLMIVTNLSSIAIVGVLFDMLIESIMFLLVYIPLRSYSGGYHACTPWRCYIISIVMIAAVLKFFNHFPFSLSLYGILLLIGLIACIILAPVESKNKPLDEQERRIYKKMALIILSAEVCIWFILTFVLHIFEEIIPLAIFTEAVMLVLGKIALNKAK